MTRDCKKNIHNWIAKLKICPHHYFDNAVVQLLSADASPYATRFFLESFTSCHCCERNFDYLNWLSTWTCGAGRPHVGLCHALLVINSILSIFYHCSLVSGCLSFYYNFTDWLIHWLLILCHILYIVRSCTVLSDHYSDIKVNDSNIPMYL